MIRVVRDIDCLQQVHTLTYLDLSYNVCQKTKFYKQVVIHKLPQLRTLDGIDLTDKDFVKAEVFYGNDVEMKKQIFTDMLPGEEFIDRRVFSSHMLDPESDEEPAEYDFFDKYDEEGKRIEVPPSYLPTGRAYPFGTGKNSVQPMLSVVDMNFVADSVDYMKEQIIKYLQEHSRHEVPQFTIDSSN